MIRKYKDFTPKIDPTAYVDESAQVIGNVTIGKNCSVWPNAVIRGDENSIKLGDNTNIQDNCVLHVPPYASLIIGNDVTIGHGAVVHGCTVGNNVLIGMGAIIMDNATIGDNCIIAAGSVVMEKAEIPSNSLVAGAPAQIKKEVKDEWKVKLKENADEYAKLAQTYKNVK
ncbi:gamma carbonic anhydrase family protein [bacterium]|nr:gamma carbonic anhydrase family protein [bacterium]